MERPLRIVSPTVPGLTVSQVSLVNRVLPGFKTVYNKSGPSLLLVILGVVGYGLFCVYTMLGDMKSIIADLQVCNGTLAE